MQIHTQPNNFLSSSCVPGTGLGTGNATVNERGWSLLSWYLAYSGEKTHSPKNYINSHAMTNCDMYSVGSTSMRLCNRGH